MAKATTRTAKASAQKLEKVGPPDGLAMRVLGKPGFPEYGGFIQDDILRELIGQRSRSIYREMADNDSTVGALLFAFNSLMKAADWTVQPVDESGNAEQYAEFAEDVLMEGMSTSWEDVIDDAASMLIYGFAVQEIVWKRRASDNMIGIERLAARRQSTIWQWVFDPETYDVTGVIQQPPTGTQITIPAKKCLLYRTAYASGNPEGRSILRSAYRSWSMKKKIENIEGVGLERDLAGLPMMLVPNAMLAADADQDAKNSLAGYKTLVKRVRRDAMEGLVLPSDRDNNGNLKFEFQLLSTGGTRSFDTTKVLDRYGKAIAMSVLADFIYLGQQSVGSFALSSDKTELFGVAVGGYLKRIARVINGQLLPRLWAVNALPEDMMPKVVPGDIEQATLAEMVSVISTIIANGGIMSMDDENKLRERAGLPPAAEEGLRDQSAPGANGGKGNDNGNEE